MQKVTTAVSSVDFLGWHGEHCFVVRHEDPTSLAHSQILVQNYILPSTRSHTLILTHTLIHQATCIHPTHMNVQVQGKD